MGTRVYVFEAEGRERSQPHMAVISSLVRAEVRVSFVPDG